MAHDYKKFLPQKVIDLHFYYLKMFFFFSTDQFPRIQLIPNVYTFKYRRIGNFILNAGSELSFPGIIIYVRPRHFSTFLKKKFLIGDFSSWLKLNPKCAIFDPKKRVLFSCFWLQMHVSTWRRWVQWTRKSALCLKNFVQ